TIVRSMEVIGDALIEMRRAPDARLLLEVALMKLCSPSDAGDLTGLISRIERLEQAVARGGVAPTSAPAASPPPVDPATGRAKLGGAVRSTPTAPRAAAPAPTRAPSAPSAPPAPTPAPVDTPPATTKPAGSPAELWPQVLTSLKPLVRALYSACSVSSPTPDTVVLSAPNAVHQAKCNEHAATVAAAFEKITGQKVALNVAVGDAPKDSTSSVARGARNKPVVDEIPHDDIDPTELTDMPTAPVETTFDRINKAFPGARIVDESELR
ncbi:MAG: polymerase gamma/tau subunit, partial [Actinomycetota bacterium]